MVNMTPTLLCIWIPSLSLILMAVNQADACQHFNHISSQAASCSFLTTSSDMCAASDSELTSEVVLRTLRCSIGDSLLATSFTPCIGGYEQGCYELTHDFKSSCQEHASLSSAAGGSLGKGEDMVLEAESSKHERNSSLWSRIL